MSSSREDVASGLEEGLAQAVVVPLRQLPPPSDPSVPYSKEGSDKQCSGCPNMSFPTTDWNLFVGLSIRRRGPERHPPDPDP